MRFLADMGVSQRVVEWLRRGPRRGPPARRGTAALAQRGDFPEGGAQQRIVLTFDLDFGEILAGSGNQIVSVVLFRLRNTRTTS